MGRASTGCWASAARVTRRRRWLQVTVERLHVAHADATTLLVTLSDVTERKRVEEALQSSEDKYRTLYTHTPIMLHLIPSTPRDDS